MPKPDCIQLGRNFSIPILYEDRTVLAIDKPAGWILAPSDWDRTGRNLQLAITSSIQAGDFWARSRNLKFLRFVHRLDADTTGVLLFSKSRAAVNTLSKLFESRQVEKVYWAVVSGNPAQSEWQCRKAISPVPGSPAQMRVDHRNGKEAETAFRVLHAGKNLSLVEAAPLTGRTHQIRLHLQDAGHPVLGDSLYGGQKSPTKAFPLALRAISLSYRDPFLRRDVTISAPGADFAAAFGFADPRGPRRIDNPPRG